MQEKHHVSKETDITNILVVTLVLMVGILIAKISSDFTKQTTSSSSRAAKPKMKSTIGARAPTVVSKIEGNGDAFCRSIEPLQLAIPSSNLYSKGGDVCGAITSTRFDPLVGCSKNGVTGLLCVRNGAVENLGNSLCRQLVSDKASTCKESCANTTSEQDLNKSCGLYSISGGLKSGKCCGNPNPSPTPTVAKPTPADTTDNCGRTHINCNNIWGTSNPSENKVLPPDSTLLGCYRKTDNTDSYCGFKMDTCSDFRAYTTKGDCYRWDGNAAAQSNNGKACLAIKKATNAGQGEDPRKKCLGL